MLQNLSDYGDYDFTADAFGAPQTENNDTPEDSISSPSSVNKKPGEKDRAVPL